MYAVVEFMSFGLVGMPFGFLALGIFGASFSCNKAIVSRVLPIFPMILPVAQ